jgi:hypothetical protein
MRRIQTRRQKRKAINFSEIRKGNASTTRGGPTKPLTIKKLALRVGLHGKYTLESVGRSASTLVLQEYENCHPEPVEGGYQLFLSYFDRLSMTFVFSLVVRK